VYVGGSGEGNYSNIQSAIDNASDGDTVYVYSGIYYERVKLNKAIDLIGENKVTTVIDAGGNGDAVKITTNGVTIEDFTFQNSGNNYQNPDVGIEIRSDDNVITGNNIINNLIGIWLFDASRNTIYENTIINNDMDGVCINEYTHDNFVSWNVISNNGFDGVCLVGFLNNYRHNISNNTIAHNSNGISIAGSPENIISGNDINNNRYCGIHLSSDSNNCKIIGNNIFNHLKSLGEGINTLTSKNILITGNIIKNNNWGVTVGYGCNQSNIEMNDILDNVGGGLALVFASDISICNNNFINNKRNAGFHYVFFSDWGQNNLWNMNYWDKSRLIPYLIFGLKSIIIRNEYLIPFPWINVDWRPAQEPYDIEV